MGAGIFSKLLGSLEAADKRRGGGNLTYQLLDAIKSAFVVFFLPAPIAAGLPAGNEEAEEAQQ